MERAIEEYRRAVELDPNHGEAHCDFGFLHYRLHRYQEAEVEFRRTAALVPELTMVHSNLAWTLFLQGKTDEAADSARQALKISNDNASAHRLLGNILAATPETRLDAIEHVEAAIRLVSGSGTGLR